MVKITEALIRKKSEHNELIISTLEELSLHQEDIDRIEHIQNWCKDLRILLLQNNLISKIENLHKLKRLEYLNLSINNIEFIENLDKLESLNKLDLTLNFIGELSGVNNLCENYNLRELTLRGNPCTDFKGYRDYVLTILPQLETLDGEEIKQSDKILAKKKFNEIIPKIIQFEAKYRIERDEQKIRVQHQQEELEIKMSEVADEDAKSKIFWDNKSEHSPEIRYEMSKQHRKRKGLEDQTSKKEVKEIRFFAACGRPYNLNQPKLEFKFLEEQDRYELDLQVYKFLDTSLIDVDVQPNYVRVKVKQKYFQLALANEVKCSESSSKRSQITGRLLIIMPKLNLNQNFISSQSENKTSSNTSHQGMKGEIKGTVNYKNIISYPEIETKKIIHDDLPDLV